MKFVRFAKSLKEEGLKPVYLIEGAEAYFRDRAVHAVQEACALTQPALNDVRYDGDALKGKLPELVAALRALPFFDERRIVRLYEFYPTEAEWEKFLAPYVCDPSPSTVLMIVNAGAKRDLKKKGVEYIDCGRESEETLSRWVYNMASRMELSVDGDAASLMVRYTAFDAARMSLELKKLSLLLGKGGRVTRAVVEEHVAKDVEYKTYELAQAASGGNRSAFSEILHDLMQKGFDENDALSALLYHFRALASLVSAKGTDAEVGKALGLHPYAVKKNREVLRRMGAARAQALYLKLYTLTADMRSGIYTKSGALSAAVAEIFFGDSQNIE